MSSEKNCKLHFRPNFVKAKKKKKLPPPVKSDNYSILLLYADSCSYFSKIRDHREKVMTHSLSYYDNDVHECTPHFVFLASVFITPRWLLVFFFSLKKINGDIFSLKLGSYNSVIASSSETVKEMLVTQSFEYAGRSDSYSLYTLTKSMYLMAIWTQRYFLWNFFLKHSNLSPFWHTFRLLWPRLKNSIDLAKVKGEAPLINLLFTSNN